jgi:SAM-dependent methyltransferase
MNREILARDRQAADQRYNDALTALDRAIIDAGKNENLSREDFDRLTNTLIVFLQQITAFVDTKDRELAAENDARLETVAESLNTVAELRTQLNVLQRALRTAAPSTPQPAPGTLAPGTLAPGTLAPDTRHQHPAPSTQHPAPRSQHPARSTQHPAPEDHQYVAFEDEFRGSDAAIADKVRAYVPLFSAASGTVVDIGCGRGEMLAALKAAGVAARGVDANGDMAAIARERGLDVAHEDALAFLDTFDDDSIGGIVATQVVEHLEPAYLSRLLATASRKLRAGAPIVLETINPACWLAFFSSYIRDLTHVRAVHPDTLQYLLRANGFSQVRIAYSAPVPEHMRMKSIDLAPEVLAAKDLTSTTLQSLAHTINANAAILNSLMFTHMDYAAIAHRA